MVCTVERRTAMCVVAAHEQALPAGCDLSHRHLVDLRLGRLDRAGALTSGDLVDDLREQSLRVVSGYRWPLGQLVHKAVELEVEQLVEQVEVLTAESAPDLREARAEDAHEESLRELAFAHIDRTGEGENSLAKVLPDLILTAEDKSTEDQVRCGRLAARKGQESVEKLWPV